MQGDAWLTSELARYACGACGEAYAVGQVRVIARREALYLVDLGCGRCGSQAVAIVTVEPESDAEAEVEASTGPRRVEPDDDPRSDSPPVSADDVLDVHRLMADFQGNVDGLLDRFDGRGR